MRDRVEAFVPNACRSINFGACHKHRYNIVLLLFLGDCLR